MEAEEELRTADSRIIAPVRETRVLTSKTVSLSSRFTYLTDCPLCLTSYGWSLTGSLFHRLIEYVYNNLIDALVFAVSPFVCIHMWAYAHARRTSHNMLVHLCVHIYIYVICMMHECMYVHTCIGLETPATERGMVHLKQACGAVVLQFAPPPLGGIGSGHELFYSRL